MNKAATKKAVKKADTAKPINFSPGRVLGEFLDKFTGEKKLENRQEALRVIVRERMQQEEATT